MRLLSCFTALVSVVPALAALPSKGVDWSSLLVEEAAGITYKNLAGVVQPLEIILKEAGVNTVRQRVWVNPSDGNYGLDYNIKLGKRAAAVGLKVYLDFHYSDTWADPGHQAKPAAWASLSTSALITEIHNYTQSVLDTFAKNSIPVSLVSLGNEITPGLLFPTGELSQPSGPKTCAQLLKSASLGVKASKIFPKPQIMLHIDNGWDFSTQQYFYDTVLNSGGGLSLSDFDIQGVSYYPFYNSAATLSSLTSSLKSMASTYNKEIMIVETDWPTACSGVTFPSDTTSIPMSPEGQKTWMRTLAGILGELGGKGIGLFYWEPAWVQNAGLGSSCAWNLMVTDQGKDMGGLEVFAEI